MNFIQPFKINGSETKALIHSTLGLSILFLISKIVGPLKSIFMAHQFGVSQTLDAYFMAQGIIDVILSVFSFAVVILSVPTLVERWLEPEQSSTGQKAISGFMNQNILLSLILSLLFFLFAPGLGHWIPGFSGPEGQQTLANFLQINSLILLFSLPLPVITGYFYSRNHYFLPVLTSLFPALGALGSIIFLSIFLEVFAIPVGNLFGAIIAFLILLGVYLRRNFLSPLSVTDFSLIRKLKPYIIPALVFSCGGSLNAMIDQWITSGLKEGGISILSYAQFVMMMPFSIITLPIITTLYPELSRSMALKDSVATNLLLSRGLLIIGLPLFPITLVLVFYRTPLLGILLYHGRFELSWVQETSAVLLGYLPGILFLSLNNLFQRIFFIRKQFSFLMWLTLITSGLNLLFDLIFSRYLSLTGIAWSSSLVEVIYFFLILSSLGKIVAGALSQIKNWLFPLLFSSASLALVLGAFSHLFPIPPEASFFNILWALLFHLGAGAAVFFPVLFWGRKGFTWKRRWV